ncbi:hypothetical protein A0J59_20495 [Cellulosimicrobium sp. I38E]|nr:hypothetical protein A0J59_20495 [Cellulosimicrobium sp. I38E]
MFSCVRLGRVAARVLPEGLRQGRAGGAGQAQVQRCSGGTSAMTSSACMPQPVQVVLPHVRHRAGLHTVCLLGCGVGSVSGRGAVLGRG